MAPIKERRAVKNPNYARFYEFESANSEICSKCPAKCGTKNWGTTLNRIRGVPVHTNWPSVTGVPIKTIYICESPSNREFSHGMPSVGLTGQSIYKKEFSPMLKLNWLDQLDESVYRTNLVRCQADSGLQKRVGNEKNMRINDASEHCIRHLHAEISNICKISRDYKTIITFNVAIGCFFLRLLIWL